MIKTSYIRHLHHRKAQNKKGATINRLSAPCTRTQSRN